MGWGRLLLFVWLFMPLSFHQQSTPLAGSACSGHFVTHTLEHTTVTPGGEEVRMFEANGSGLAINDLDNDGRLDIVLGNHAGQNTILWNEGDLQFTAEAMPVGDTRAVTIVDLDGDGWQDIIITRRASAPNYWRNQGERKFQSEILPGISQPLYAINWGDLDNDGDLDLVGGTYDAELLAELGHEFLTSNRGGVYYYENRQGTFSPTQLTNEAQALALLLTDLNNDNRADILVGNDFALRDFVWYRTDTGWRWISPFETTSHSTMSFDSGDINNDEQQELFSTDMKPYTLNTQTDTIWQSINESIVGAGPQRGDPQTVANVLLHQNTDVAQNWGIDATGWSWSGKFGDLDQDGHLDLYVVNGMIEKTLFAALPGHELVEENQAFRNTGEGQYIPAPEWQLGSTASGRAMSMADLDNDGDLDIVVNNLRSPAQLFENQLCGGKSIIVDLLWHNNKNTRALGAYLTLHMTNGTYTRQIKASSGYLSGDPAQVHFGVPASAAITQLEIRWPDGETRQIEAIEPGTHITIQRN